MENTPLEENPLPDNDISSWNYRLVLNEHGDYVVYEVYYNAEGVAHSWVEYPCVMGSTLEEASRDYAAFGEAFNKPVLAVSKDGKIGVHTAEV